LKPKFDPNNFDPPLKAVLGVVVDLVVVVAVTVVEDPVVVAVEDPVEDPVAEVAITDAGAMGQPTAPRTADSLLAQIPTVGLVVMIVPEPMRVEHVTTKYRVLTLVAVCSFYVH
jgi:hypothetical protein